MNVSLGSEDKIQKALVKMKGVEEIYSCHGVYDILIKVQADEIKTLTTLITDKIRKLPNIEMTMTMLIAGETEQESIWQIKKQKGPRSLAEHETEKDPITASQYRKSAQTIIPK